MYLISISYITNFLQPVKHLYNENYYRGFHTKFIMAPTDQASNNIIIVYIRSQPNIS